MDEKERTICGEKTFRYFYKIMHPSLSTEHLRIPPDFMKHIIMEGDCVKGVLAGPSGDRWKINLCEADDGTYIQDGWKDFVRDHWLGDHEFLVFRYDGNMHFTVKIFDKTGCERGALFHLKERAKTQTKDATSSRNKQDRRTLELHEKGLELRLRALGRQLKADERQAKVWKAAMSFTSSHPYFLLTIKQYGGDHCFQSIPGDFAKEHLPGYKRQIVVSISKGEYWNVTFIPTREKYTFSGGWAAFARDNKLKGGDICAFELIRKFELSVHFFRLGSS